MQALLKQSERVVERAVADVVVPAGEPYLGRIAKGQFFRIVDLEGNQAVDTLFYSAADLSERYSAADTIRLQRKLYLSTGTVLYSSYARPMLTIVADTCGRHDTLGGACATESNTVRYGQHTKHMHACRDNFLRAIAEADASGVIRLEKRDLASNINFFMNVPVTPAGKLTFEDGISAGGKYVEMRAEQDVIVLISNCPQLNNPCNAYNPTPIRLLWWND